MNVVCFLITLFFPAVAREEGIRGFYRGCGPPLLLTGFVNTVCSFPTSLTPTATAQLSHGFFCFIMPLFLFFRPRSFSFALSCRFCGAHSFPSLTRCAATSQPPLRRYHFLQPVSSNRARQLTMLPQFKKKNSQTQPQMAMLASIPSGFLVLLPTYQLPPSRSFSAALPDIPYRHSHRGH